MLTADPRIVLEEGAQVMAAAGLRPPARPIGYVTSSYPSPTLGRSIALALIAGGRSRMGETVFVPGAAGERAVEVTSPLFYDPQGTRLNG